MSTPPPGIDWPWSVAPHGSGYVVQSPGRALGPLSERESRAVCDALNRVSSGAPREAPPTDALREALERTLEGVGRANALLDTLVTREGVGMDAAQRIPHAQIILSGLITDLRTRAALASGALREAPPREPSEAAIDAAAKQLPGEVRGNIATAIEAAYGVDWVQVGSREPDAPWNLGPDQEDPSPGNWLSDGKRSIWLGACDFNDAECDAIRDALNRVSRAASSAEPEKP